MLQNSQENNCDGVSLLTHFNQIFHFNTSRKLQKTFLMILGVIEMEQWAVSGLNISKNSLENASAGILFLIKL